MKTLYIVRHAKSSWDSPELADDERPLLEKGKKRTNKVVNHLREKSVSVDLIMSSHAVRALETARMIADGLDYSQEKIKVTNQLYFTHSNKLLDQIYGLTDDYASVMMVGHNPTFTSFANLFVQPQIDWLPTSGVVCIEFDTDKWEEIPLASRTTKFVVYPRHL